MKRLFVAIHIRPSEKLIHAIRKIKDNLSDDQIKWVNEDLLHITLKFMGETPDKEIDQIIHRLKKSVAGFSSFDFQISGFGYFGNSKFPRVLWLGIDAPENLQMLYQNIQKALKNYGPAEKKELFKPHLTIGRVRNFKSVTALFETEAEFADTVFQNITVKEIILYESFLKPDGPVHSVLEKVSLE